MLHHNTEESVIDLLDELTRVSGSLLELIEDTTTFRPRSFGGSYFVRDVNQYIAWVTARGFRLVNVQPMNAWASEKALVAVQRLAGLMSRRACHQGQPASAPEVAARKLLLSITQRIDPRLAPLSARRRCASNASLRASANPLT